MKKGKSGTNDGEKEFLEGRDWRKLYVISSKASRKTYCAICLHCFSFYSNHRSVPKHGKMCPYFNHTNDPGNVNQSKQIDPNRIEKIIKHRIFKNHLQYCVKWKGKPASSNTWEDMDDLLDAKSHVKEYWASISRDYPFASEDDSQHSSASDSESTDSDTSSSDSSDSDTSSDDDSDEDSSDDSQKVSSDESDAKSKAPSYNEEPAEPVPVEYTTTEVQTDPSIKILAAVYENNQLKWMVNMHGQQKILTNEEVKEHYLSELVSFYESCLEFTA